MLSKATRTFKFLLALFAAFIINTQITSAQAVGTDEINTTPFLHLKVVRGDGSQSYMFAPDSPFDEFTHITGGPEKMRRFINLDKGQTWSLQLEKRSNVGRIRVCVAVDGRHVIGQAEVAGDLKKSETWSKGQCYIMSGEKLTVGGWRKGDQVAQFVVTDARKSDAARKFGDFGGMGTIAVAVFKEQIVEIEPEVTMRGGDGSRGLGTASGAVSTQKVKTLTGVNWEPVATSVVILRYLSSEDIRAMGYRIPSPKPAANRIFNQ